MDMLIDLAALSRRQSTRIAVKVLEAAIEHALGFRVVIQGLQCWVSPIVFEEGRTPERYVQLPPWAPALPAGTVVPLEALLGQMQLLPPSRTPIEEIRTPKQMIADRKERLKRERESK